MNSIVRMVLVFALFVALSGALAAELRLDDGTVIRGEILSRSDSLVVVRTASLGDVRVQRPRIVSGLDEAPSTRAAAPPARPRRGDPAGYALFLLPTAFTPPAGAWNFRDFELFFLNLGFSPTSSTVISAGALFPITTEFQLLSFGVKQQIFQRDGAAFAVTANGTFPVSEDSDGALYNANAVFSKRFAGDGYDDAAGLHAVLGYWKPSGEEGGFAYGGGMEARLGPRAKFITEVYVPMEDPDFAMLTLGFRLHGDRLSADIAGIRPVDAGGSFLFFPLLIINYRF